MNTTPQFFEYEYTGTIRVHNEPSPANGFGDYAEYRDYKGMTYATSDAQAIEVLTRHFRTLGGDLMQLVRVEFHGDEMVNSPVEL